MEKINVLKIFKDHIKTLTVYDTGKYCTGDFWVFYLIPILVALVLSFFIKFSFVLNTSSDLITFYSVFGGFMLNIIVLIYGYDITKFKNPETAKEVLKQIVSNVSYLILFATLSVIFLFVIKFSFVTNITYFLKSNLDQYLILIIKRVIVTIVTFSLINFFLTILMILKRFYSLESNKEIK